MHPSDWEELERRPQLASVRHFGVELRVGSRVRLWPKPGADIMDMILKGKLAQIEALEQDYEGNVHIAVVIDDDPGRELGLQRHPAHRFFYALDEIEPCDLPDNQPPQAQMPDPLRRPV